MRIFSSYRAASLAIAAAVLSACGAERTVGPQSPAPTAVLSPATSQVPLLYVVDGVRLKRDQIPSLSGDQVASVRVMKGTAALKAYGADASYGAVIITTKAAAGPRG